MVTRIVIADDHGLVRSGLRMLVNSEPDLRVVGEAEDGHCALRLAEELGPEILLADISMPGPSGIELAAELRSRVPATRVLIVSMHEDQCLVKNAVLAGAAGYVTKRALEGELIKAIHIVAKGGAYFAPGPHAAPPVEQLAFPDPQVLCDDEAKLLRALLQAVTVQAAADLLKIDPADLQSQRSALFEKLGLHNRADLMRYALQQGLLESQGQKT